MNGRGHKGYCAVHFNVGEVGDMTGILYMVQNGRLENSDQLLCTMGRCNDVSKRFPAHILERDFKRYLNVDVSPRPRYAENVDWFVWEPVGSASLVRGNDLLRLSSQDLDRPVLMGDHPFQLSVPFGRFGEARKELVLSRPCSLRQLMQAVQQVYMGPATPADVDAVCDQKAAGDDEYTRSAKEALARGRSVRLVDLCGCCEYSTISTDAGRVVDTVTGVPRSKPSLGCRHPFGDCMGMVRFEGVERVSAEMFEVLMGS